MLPIYDMSTTHGRVKFHGKVEQLAESVSPTSEAGIQVAQIIDEVRADGDDAVIAQMRKWTDPKFGIDRVVVSESDIQGSLSRLTSTAPDLLAVLKRSIAHVREYQRHIIPEPPSPIQIAGATLGLRFTPVNSVGLLVPGGRAAYPSTVIMLAVPAIEAGVSVDNITVVTPPPTILPGQPVSKPGGPLAARDGDISPLVLATFALLGIKRVFRIGGAGAVAALALGTTLVPRVDLIVGPGNQYVQLAKQQLAGRVGIDGFYGPSEIVTIADESANPARVAADLIAQAEHDPGRCFLVSWSRNVIDRVTEEIQTQLVTRKRAAAIEQSLSEWSAAILVRDEAEAITVADTLAAEHVSLAVKDPAMLLERLRHGGEFFLGDATPVAAGDYYAGPSHCLPTGTTARFASGISVYTFLKRSGTVAYQNGMPAQAIADVARFAEAEGLDGHAESARLRG